MTEVQFVRDSVDDGAAHVSASRTRARTSAATTAAATAATTATTSTATLPPSSEALTLEWAFGLHRDYKAQIHNLSLASGSNAATAAAAATSMSSNSKAGRSGSSAVTTAAMSTATVPRMLSTLSRTSVTTLSPTTAAASVYEHRRVFYPLAHIGVIYDAIHNTQQHLLGHRYTIVATCCSHNRRFLVTVDEGDRALWPLRQRHSKKQKKQPKTAAATSNKPKDSDDDDEEVMRAADEEAAMSVDPRSACRADEDDGSVLIVWDTVTCLPVRTLPVGRYGGVLCCAISPDALHIATINRREPQELMLWAWTAEGGDGDGKDEGVTAAAAPALVRRIPASDEQTCVRFSDDDAHVLCSNGLRRVFFWVWGRDSSSSSGSKGDDEDDGGDGEEAMQSSQQRRCACIRYYSPPILRKELKTSLGHFTQTVLVPGTTMACSGTVDGDVVLWQLQPRDRVVQAHDKTLLKIVRVHAGAVTCVSSTRGHIVTAGVDGCVRFLDTKLRLVAWFDELHGGPIVSLSFDRTTTTATTSSSGGGYDEGGVSLAAQHEQQLVQQRSGTSAAAHFASPNFMVATAHAMLLDVPARAFHPGDKALLRGKLLVQGQDDAIQCLATHPCLSRLAIAGLSGNVHVWDYTQRRVLTLSLFRALRVRCMAYSATGAFLAVGFTNGHLKLLHGDTLEEQQTFRSKRSDALTHVCFSADSRMLATGSASGYVGVYEYTMTRHTHSGGHVAPAAAGGGGAHADTTGSAQAAAAAAATTTPYTRYEWVLIGHHKAHKTAVTALHFASHTHDGEVVRLMSVGADKRLIEYNLAESHPETGLQIRAAHKITQGAVPTGLLWTSSRCLLDRRSTPRSDGEGRMLCSASSSSSSSSSSRNMSAADGSNEGQQRVDTEAAMARRGGHAAAAPSPPAPPLDYLVLASDEYKLCVYLSDWTRQCVKTVLAPTFGGPVTTMAVVPLRTHDATTQQRRQQQQQQTKAALHGGNNGSSRSNSTSASPPDGLSNDDNNNNDNDTKLVDNVDSIAGDERACLVYATADKVVGLMQLPLRGDPCACMGVVAHPGTLTHMAVSHDGAFVFTAGGDDQAVLQWRIDGTRLDAEAAAATSSSTTAQSLAAVDTRHDAKSTDNDNSDSNDNDDGDDSAVPLDHLLTVIEGGGDGPVVREIIDYFYYAQIRAQGETTTAKRELVGAVSFAQVPHLMRALGYYPTELELGHLAYEVANVYGPPGQSLAAIDMDAIVLTFSQFLRLYVNYRAVVGVTARDVRAAFAALGADAVTGQLSRDVLFASLSARAEALRSGEVAAALHALLGDGLRVDMLEDAITARGFAEGLLGFDDYDDDEDDEDDNKEGSGDDEEGDGKVAKDDGGNSGARQRSTAATAATTTRVRVEGRSASYYKETMALTADDDDEDDENDDDDDDNDKGEAHKQDDMV